MAPTSKLKEILENRRNPDNATISAIAEIVIGEKFKEYLPTLESKIEKFVDAYVNSRVEEKLKGQKGDRGDIGLRGESIKGDKGDIGISVKGEKGDTGKQGIPGKTPVAGIDYPTKREVEATASQVAEAMLLGKAGENGSPDSPEVVTTKINKSAKKIDPKQIDGLDKALRDIKRGKGGGGGASGGGGQGAVIHEQFIGDGSTTSFTLASKVAGAGTAVYACRYEGQVQYLGDQYTITDNILAFTFTPDDGAFIEITYSRT